MTLDLVHKLHDHFDGRFADRPLFRYTYQPKVPATESPKPSFHPLYTLKGHAVTVFRPHDHRWHHGLAMTCAHLSHQNFWGSRTFIRDRGYVQLDNNGRQEHEKWTSVILEDNRAVLNEELTWVAAGGTVFLREQRQIRIDATTAVEGYWTIGFVSRLTNVSGQRLDFGSPTTAGRPSAGYGSLFWRGPRCFRGGMILADDGREGESVMGQAAPWLAFIGTHDGTDDRSTLLFVDDPSNPRFPTKWFVRSEPYACVSFSFMFDEEYQLDHSKMLLLRYRILVADGAWDRERIEQAMQPGCGFESWGL